MLLSLRKGARALHIVLTAPFIWRVCVLLTHLFICPGTDISVTVTAIGVKFCTMVVWWSFVPDWVSALLVAISLGVSKWASKWLRAVMIARTFHQGPWPGPGLGYQGPGPGQWLHSQGPGQGPGFEYKDQDKDKTWANVFTSMWTFQAFKLMQKTWVNWNGNLPQTITADVK